MTDPARERIRGLVFDVDGVLTDGTVYVSADGGESKRFSILDGTALMWARLAGYRVAWLSGRESNATTRRAEELDIEWVYQGVRDKSRRVREWAESVGLELEEILYMGDDHIDLPVFEIVGISVTPANADAEIRDRATHVTEARGGEGAAREAIRWVLAGAGKLEQVTGRYRAALGEEEE